MVLYPGDLATQEQQQEGKCGCPKGIMVRRGRERRGKKGHTGHKAANSSKRGHAPHKHAHGHKPSLFCGYQLPRPAAVRPSLAGTRQKSACPSLAKTRRLALWYSSSQPRSHCSENDRGGENTPPYYCPCWLMQETCPIYWSTAAERCKGQETE